MGRHKDPDTLAFIEWLEAKGEELGFVAKTEVYIRNFFADLVWYLLEDQDPIISFEIETKDGPQIFSNTAKWFGQSSDKVTKPWRHFMIVYKSGLSELPKESLHNVMSLHNIRAFEDVFNNKDEKERLEKELNQLEYDLPTLLERYIKVKPLGESLPAILQSLQDALKMVHLDNQK